VQSRVVTNLQLGLGVTQLFSLSADLPVVLTQTGYDVASLTGLGELVPLSATAIGDLRLTPKVAPLSAANGPLGPRRRRADLAADGRPGGLGR
jgi:hypothetical protein